jgi:hypothetical protein
MVYKRERENYDRPESKETVVVGKLGKFFEERTEIGFIQPHHINILLNTFKNT